MLNIAGNIVRISTVIDVYVKKNMDISFRLADAQVEWLA